MDAEWAAVSGSDQSARDDVSTVGWALPDLSPEDVKLNEFRSEVKGWVVDQLNKHGTPQKYLTKAWRADLVFYMASFPLCAHT